MSNNLAIEADSDTEYITLDHDYVHLNGKSSTSGRPGRESNQLENSTENRSNALESETVLDFHIKEEESGDNLEENRPVVGRFPRVDDKHHEQMTFLEGEKEVPYEMCDIKQEELEVDECIIGGFSDNSAYSMSHNKHDNEELLQDNSKNNQSQIERRRKVRQTTNRAEKSVANSSTSSFSIISSSVEKQWSSNNEIIPKHSGKGLANNGKATQSYPSDVSLKLNVPYDAATSQATGAASYVNLVDNHQDIRICSNGRISSQNMDTHGRSQQSSNERNQDDSTKMEISKDSVINLIDLRSALQQLKTAEDGRNLNLVERNKDTSSRHPVPNQLHTHDEQHTIEITYSYDAGGKISCRLDQFKMHKRVHNGLNPFPCDVCNKEFSSSAACKQHKKSHTDEAKSADKPYSCGVCGKEYFQRNLFEMHKRVHAGSKSFPCDVCNMKFSSSTACKRHKKRHTDKAQTSDKPYSCDVCGKMYSRRNQFEVHKLAHTASKLFPCDVCNKKFSSSAACKRHKKRHNNEVHTGKVRTGNKSYSCDVCGKVYSRKNQFEVHKRVHTGSKPFSCDVCSKKFSSSAACKQHKKRHNDEVDTDEVPTDGKPYLCDICGKEYSRRDQFEVHKLAHNGSKRFPCDVCKKEFISSAGCTRHKKRHTGTGDKPYSCDVCSKKFTSSDICKRHIERHTEKSYCMCDICGKCFRTQGYLDKHKLIHSGEKPHCDTCGKRFKGTEQLEVHKRVHTLHKRYSCGVCGKKFALLDIFEKHEKRHAEKGHYFVCDICVEVCKTLEELNTHKLTHSNLSYMCAICGKAFEDQSSLEKHKSLLHPEGKPFSCDTCGKIFKLSENLERHEQIHTGEKPYSGDKQIHAGEKPYPCGVCEMKFASLRGCSMHKRTHTEKRLYMCTICGKGFQSVKVLKLHKLSHSDKKPAVETAENVEAHTVSTSEEKPDSYLLHVPGQQDSLNEIVTKQMSSHSEIKQYACAICKMTFSSSNSCREHEKTHTEKEYYCMCGKVYKTLEDLNTHKLTHSRKMRDMCDLCDKCFDTAEDLKAHRLTHSKRKRYSCDVCQKQFFVYEHLQSHLIVHRREKLHACAICKKRFISLLACKEHETGHLEKKQVESREQLEDQNTHNLTYSKKKPRDSLDVHEEQFNLWDFLKDETILTTEEEENKHELSHSEGSFTKSDDCGTSAMSFASPRPATLEDRNTTIVTHSQGDLARTNNDVDSLMRLVAPQSKTLEDQTTPMMTHSESELARTSNDVDSVTSYVGLQSSILDALNKYKQVNSEKNSLHTGENAFSLSCADCGKTFVNRRNLKRHQIIHNDEEPISCEVCKNVFKSHGDLKKHERAVHAEEKHFSCDICGCEFLSSLDCALHENGHSRTTLALSCKEEETYSCDACNKVFAKIDSLHRHQNITCDGSNGKRLDRLCKENPTDQNIESCSRSTPWATSK